MGHQKCNTDGISKGNPGHSSYGFCIRDHSGNPYYAQAGTLGHMTNIQAESREILEAVKYLEKEEHATTILEIGSLIMLNIIKRDWRVPWEVEEMVKEIQEQIHKQQIHIQLAGYTANLVAIEGST